MRIFGDPSDATLNRLDYVFVGLLPIPFDLAFTAVFGPFRTQAAQVFIPGAVAAETFIPGAVAADMHIAGAVAAEVFE